MARDEYSRYSSDAIFRSTSNEANVLVVCLEFDGSRANGSNEITGRKNIDFSGNNATCRGERACFSNRATCFANGDSWSNTARAESSSRPCPARTIRVKYNFPYRLSCSGLAHTGYGQVRTRYRELYMIDPVT